MVYWKYSLNAHLIDHEYKVKVVGIWKKGWINYILNDAFVFYLHDCQKRKRIFNWAAVIKYNLNTPK